MIISNNRITPVFESDDVILGKRAASTQPIKRVQMDAARWRADAYAHFTGVRLRDQECMATIRLDPGEETHILKNEYVYHVTRGDSKEFKITESRLFCTYDDIDRYAYRGFFGAQLWRKGYREAREAKILVKRDIKAPSHIIQVKEFDKLFKSHRDEIFNAIVDNKIKFEHRDAKDRKKVISELESTSSQYWVQNIYYYYFIAGYGTPFRDNPIYQKYIDILMSKGYNAMIDSNDSKYSFMQSKRPLILLDAVNTTGSVQLTKIITKDDIIENMSKWIELQNK